MSMLPRSSWTGIYGAYAMHGRWTHLHTTAAVITICVLFIFIKAILMLRGHGDIEAIVVVSPAFLLLPDGSYSVPGFRLIQFTSPR